MENNRAPWAKIQGGEGKWHHLAHHCADVAACLEVILSLPVFRRRMERAAGGVPASVTFARLVVLAFLHDAGKLHPGFQAKGWPESAWRGPRHGHVREGAAIFREDALKPIALNLCLAELIGWGTDENLLSSVLAHHGRPIDYDLTAAKSWGPVKTADFTYDPVSASAEIGATLRRWFPEAFLHASELLPSRPQFAHLFAGMVALADWLGSDRRFFPFVRDLDPGYINLARKQARRAVSAIGLDVADLRRSLAGGVDFHQATGATVPYAQQQLVGSSSLEEQLLILEAETGSGKTEAAFWRFARLFEAGRVDGLYFALPTRSAAMQLHSRINRMLRHLFGALAPEAVLAVPGYLKAGEAEGVALPGWQVHWDDDGGKAEEELAARWAAESSKRFLAATIAVGTVDQAMLGALRVKHAHLRSAALSRSLLVIDEVHASDSYMTEVQGHLLRMHLDHGGHAMLMSATLGSRARSKWLQAAQPSYEDAVQTAYPALWCGKQSTPATADSSSSPKHVSMTLLNTMAAESCARLALDAARRGARVLVVRNTVEAAVATWQAVRQAGGEQFLLTVHGGPALHHGRFAAEDRRLLDRAVEQALSPQLRNDGGVLVIGTQTLEQSLDIDADYLLTDLCPVDVLLQRIGRLYRRAALSRPSDFQIPSCTVLAPEKGLAALLKPDFENGLGARKIKGVYEGIYRDLSMIELTRRLIEEYPVWELPAMNRMLVESATHPERIEALHHELGREWSDYSNQVIGAEMANQGLARMVLLPFKTPFADRDALFPSDEERIRTRLGGEGARVKFAGPVTGPFGEMIQEVTLPEHWSVGVDTDTDVTPEVSNLGLRFSAGSMMFSYDRSGLMKVRE
jgi:CRISPR-associated endonuclease/helicase Cas3